MLSSAFNCYWLLLRVQAATSEVTSSDQHRATEVVASEDMMKLATAPSLLVPGSKEMKVPQSRSIEDNNQAVWHQVRGRAKHTAAGTSACYVVARHHHPQTHQVQCFAPCFNCFPIIWLVICFLYCTFCMGVQFVLATSIHFGHLQHQHHQDKIALSASHAKLYKSGLLVVDQQATPLLLLLLIYSQKLYACCLDRCHMGNIHAIKGCKNLQVTFDRDLASVINN
jgi:hypothetical protein